MWAVAAVLFVGLVVLPLLTLKIELDVPGEKTRTLVDMTRK